VGPRASLDGYGKSRPHLDSIPGPPAPSESLYRLSFHGPKILPVFYLLCHPAARVRHTDNFLHLLFNIIHTGKETLCKSKKGAARCCKCASSVQKRLQVAYMTCHRLGGSLSVSNATINTVHSLRLPHSTYTLLQPGALELFAYAFCTMPSRQHTLERCGMNYTHVLKETHQYSTSTFTSITCSQSNQTTLIHYQRTIQ